MKFARIHIVGAPGSGKSTLGRQLAAQKDVALTELDNIHWMNETGTYGVKRPEAERDALYSEVVARPAWVIEGIYNKWTQASFEQADLIIILTPNNLVRNWRLLMRFLTQKNSAQKSWKNFYDLATWANNYSRKTIPLIIEQTAPYAAKRKICLSADSAMLALGNIEGATE